MNIAMGEMPTFQSDPSDFFPQSKWITSSQPLQEQLTMGAKKKQQLKRTVSFPFGKW
jgi:hypothetical protein